MSATNRHTPLTRLIVAWVFALVAFVVIGLAQPVITSAHPLDEFPELTYLTISPTNITIELDVTPGVLLAAETLAQIDTNGDNTISDTEARTYVEMIVGKLSLSVDGTAIPVTLTSYTMPAVLNIQAGYGEIEIVATADLPTAVEDSTTTHEIAYTNGFTPAKAKYQVNTFIEQGATISLGAQNRSDDQQSINVAFAIGGTIATADQSSTTPSVTASTASNRSGWLGTLLDFVERPEQSPVALMLALGLAIILGGIHALTPGHGKTLVAAYLVGSKGTVKHAAALGATVTVTHTASVVIIGLIALFASHLLLPNVLVPSLQVISGLLVVVLGGRLILQRWQVMRHTRSTIPSLPHTHGGIAGMHDHGDGRLHSHAVPEGPLTGRSLLAMGVSGGLVPCPEALGIMILAVGLNHITLGLGLIVAFSLGLAAVLIGIGILLVRARSVLDRVGLRGTLAQPWLPLLSSGIVLMLGIGTTIKGFASFGGMSALGSSTLIVAGIGLAGTATGAGIAMLLMGWWHSPIAPAPTSALVPLDQLPPRYRDGHAVSSAPMGAASLVFDSVGAVAWDRVWGHDESSQPFCDLALAGGPPHRGTMLEPASNATMASSAQVRVEIARGLRMVTGLEVIDDVEPGWVGLVCRNPTSAVWMTMAINAENVRARQEGAVVFLPADATFTTDKEIKNVVTAVAKTWHYWSEHTDDVVRKEPRGKRHGFATRFAFLATLSSD